MLSTLFGRKTFCYYISFDAEKQPSIVELSKDTTNLRLPHNFPIEKFIELFEKWKNAPTDLNGDNFHNKNTKSDLFVALRDLHQAGGVNKGSFVFGAEDEMLLFGEYVKKVQKIRSETHNKIEMLGYGDSPERKLITQLQDRINTYAMLLGVGDVRLELAIDKSQAQICRITLNQKGSLENGTVISGKQYILDDILLKDMNRNIKTEEVLLKEIQEKISAFLKTVPSTTPAPIESPVTVATPAAAVAPTPRPSVSGDRDARALQYNRDFLKGEGKELKELANTVPKVLPDDVLTRLKTYIDTPSSTNANSLQDLLKANYKIDTGARGSVGPLTLAAIQKVSKDYQSQNGNQAPTAPRNIAREFDEIIEKQIMTQIDERIKKMLNDGDLIQYDASRYTHKFVESPFNRLKATLQGLNGINHGDLQMSVNFSTAFERVLTGTNLDNWRKLSIDEQEKIIKQANLSWNTKAQVKVREKNATL